MNNSVHNKNKYFGEQTQVSGIYFLISIWHTELHAYSPTNKTAWLGPLGSDKPDTCFNNATNRLDYTMSNGRINSK